MTHRGSANAHAHIRAYHAGTRRYLKTLHCYAWSIFAMSRAAQKVSTHKESGPSARRKQRRSALFDCQVVETSRGKRMRAVEVPNPVQREPTPSPKKRRTQSLSPRKPHDGRGGGVPAVSEPISLAPMRSTQGKVRRSAETQTNVALTQCRPRESSYATSFLIERSI